MSDPLDRQELLPIDAVDSVSLPRDRRGNAPQSAAVMLLAAYGVTPRAWFASAVLVAALRDLGTTEAGARAVVHRLARRGVLEGRRHGRRTSYRLALPAAQALAHGGQALVTFTEQAERWDGRWTIVAFSVPNGADPARALLRARLRWRGFQPLFDGVWVSPQEPDRRLELVLAGAPDAACTVFRADRLPLGPGGGGRDPLTLWDYPAVAGAYTEFLTRWEPVAAQAEAGTLTGPQALAARVCVQDDYRRFVVIEPRFPLAVMPQGWPRRQAKDVFLTLFDGLADPGLHYLHALIDESGDLDPEEDAPGTHLSTDLVAGLRVE